MSLLNIEQKKGSSEHIEGKLTVYAIVDIDPSETMSTKHPIASMIHNGLLVAQGNYKEQNSLKDFLEAEMGETLEEGLEEFIDKLDGLEGALDPQKLRDKIRNLDDIKEFIPTPAKIVPFHSEEEILREDGDIFFVGKFKNIANANLSVNSFPILYQARYREQELVLIKNEIDQLISQIEHIGAPQSHYTVSGIDIESKILKEYIPDMLYSKKEGHELNNSIKQFKRFLEGYTFKEDINRIISIITDTQELSALHNRLLELYAKKITEVHKEQFNEVEKINKEIESIEKKLNLQ